MNSKHSSTLLDRELEKILRDVSRDFNMQNATIGKVRRLVKGQGYLGIITRVEISGSNKTVSLIVKTSSKNKIFREYSFIAELFAREIYMYTVAIPTLIDFEVKHGLSPMSSFAKCHRTSLTDNNEALVLEDLNARGYKLWDRHAPMDEAHVTLALKELGKFHALSLGLREKNPKLYEEVTEPMNDMYVLLWKNNMQLMQDFCNRALKYFCPVKEHEAYVIFKRLSRTGIQFLLNLESYVDRYSVILHGDPWTNNIMFGYKDADKPNFPTELCFLDLQISRLGPPVIDVAYFFYNSASSDIIDNVHHYLDVYYKSLSAHLKKLGLDSDVVYPYSVMYRQWKECARFGLFLSMFIIKLMLTGDDEVPDLTQALESGKGLAEEYSYTLAKSDEYNSRIKHIIVHFIENDFV